MLHENYHENDMMLCIKSTSYTSISKFCQPDPKNILIIFTYNMTEGNHY
jgi:hypothetical protein